MTDHADDLALIVEAAAHAGEMAVDMRAAGLITTYKADKTPVTDADLAVDSWLKNRLLDARPD